jgi:hypothetical protein
VARRGRPRRRRVRGESVEAPHGVGQRCDRFKGASWKVMVKSRQGASAFTRPRRLFVPTASRGSNLARYPDSENEKELLSNFADAHPPHYLQPSNHHQLLPHPPHLLSFITMADDAQVRSRARDPACAFYPTLSDRRRQMRPARHRVHHFSHTHSAQHVLTISCTA